MTKNRCPEKDHLGCQCCWEEGHEPGTYDAHSFETLEMHNQTLLAKSLERLSYVLDRRG